MPGASYDVGMSGPPDHTVSIRRATFADAPALARLRWEFTDELAEPTEALSDFLPRFAETLGAYLDSGRWTVWLAEVDDELVGTVWVERVDKVPRPYRRPEHWGYVTNVYVAPDHRDRGTGALLLDAAITEARAAGWELLLVWPSELSGRFYARAGFRPSAEALELELAVDSTTAQPASE